MPNLLDGDITINTVRYALARDVSKDKPGLAWAVVGVESEQEGEPGEVVTARWDAGWFQGIGESKRLGPETVGCAFTEHVDVSNYGYARLAEANFTVTPTNVPSDLPTYFFEATDNTTWFVYMVCGRYGYKLSISGTTITNEDEKDFGANAAAGHPDYFEGKVYVPLGQSVVLNELTTITALGGAADTWTGASATTVAYALARAMGTSNTARLWRGVATSGHVHRVDGVAATPTTGANWSGGATGATGFEVGDSSQAITNLIDTGVIMLVAKKDGLYRFDVSGIATKLPLPEQIDDNNGTGLIALSGTELAIFNHRSGLYMINGDRVTAIGPDTNPNNSDIPNITLEPWRIRWYETAIASDDWAYALGRVTEGGTTRTYIFAIRMQGGLENAEWYTYDYLNSACRGLYVDKSMRLWTQDGTKIRFWQLGQNGAPDAGRDSNGRGAASTTHRIYLPETPFYRSNGQAVPTVKKQLQAVEVVGRNIGATCPIQVKVSREGAALEDVGGTITTSGEVKRYWTTGTNDTGYLSRIVLDITTTGAYVTTTDPQIHSVVARGNLRPDLARLYECVVSCSRHTGVGTIANPKLTRDELNAIKASGQSVAVVDPNGEAIYANITEVSDLMTAETDASSITYTLKLRLRERPSSSAVDVTAPALVFGTAGISQVNVYEGGSLVGSVT